MLRWACWPGLVLAVSQLALVGCTETTGGELPGEEIACDWFDDPTNCWRASLDEVAGQLPPVEQTGSLSADGKTCTYADGFELVFINPLDPQRLGQPDYLKGFAWDIEARRDGDRVFAYREPSAQVLLIETQLGTFRLEADNPSVVLTCPDGKQYNVPLAGLLVNCESEDLPAKIVNWDTAGVLFALRGTGGPDLLMFHCLAP
jgi:hypothetical protein